MSKLNKVLEGKFYIFERATEKEISNTLPKDWTEQGIYYVNCDNDLVTVADAEKHWNSR